ncbi:MAG: hypothetical protein WD771_07960 [Gemmatimonadaceae bacterium]
MLTGCSLLTAPGGEAADARGSWQYTGTQSAPTLQLQGTMEITQQSGEAIGGTASWEEHDGIGVVGMDGGTVAGRVIGESDVDFDVITPAGDRRHVGRLTADTMTGAWVQLPGGESGEFRAVRTAP